MKFVMMIDQYPGMMISIECCRMSSSEEEIDVDTTTQKPTTKDYAKKLEKIMAGRAKGSGDASPRSKSKKGKHLTFVTL